MFPEHGPKGGGDRTASRNLSKSESYPLALAGHTGTLSGRELWEMQGGSVSDWDQAREDQHPVMLKAAVREVGWRTAQSLLQALFTKVPSVAGERCG